MRQVYVVLFLIGLLFLVNSCGIKEVEGTDESTQDEQKQDAYNCSDDVRNSYGCYGSDKEFSEKMIVGGIWSVYKRSNIGASANVFYDRYQLSYNFKSDGSGFKQEASGSYSDLNEWGVNDKGDELKVSDGNTITYKKQFVNEANCFEVTIGSTTHKFCKESLQAGSSNSAGLYGASVVLGYLSNYSFSVAGVWDIIDEDGSIERVTLNENGTTNSGGVWGVSADAKIISIDAKAYLTHQYLEDSSCIKMIELQGLSLSGVTKKLCKQT